MGDGKHGAVRTDTAQGPQYMLLGLRIQVGGDFVQQQKIRVGSGCPCDGKKLPLALGKELRRAGVS